MWGNPHPRPNDTRGAPPRIPPPVPIFWQHVARHAPRLLIASREFRRGASRAILSRVPIFGPAARFCVGNCRPPPGLGPGLSRFPASGKSRAVRGARLACNGGAWQEKNNLGGVRRPRCTFPPNRQNLGLLKGHYCSCLALSRTPPRGQARPCGEKRSARLSVNKAHSGVPARERFLRGAYTTKLQRDW